MLMTSYHIPRLYPNPNAAAMQPQWMQLFEFVGRMLGKAIYEGHLVEVPFAHFFLNSLLGRTNTLDELPTLASKSTVHYYFTSTVQHYSAST